MIVHKLFLISYYYFFGSHGALMNLTWLVIGAERGISAASISIRRPISSQRSPRIPGPSLHRRRQQGTATRLERAHLKVRLPAELRR